MSELQRNQTIAKSSKGFQYENSKLHDVTCIIYLLQIWLYKIHYLLLPVYCHNFNFFTTLTLPSTLSQTKCHFCQIKAISVAFFRLTNCMRSKAYDTISKPTLTCNQEVFFRAEVGGRQEV